MTGHDLAEALVYILIIACSVAALLFPRGDLPPCDTEDAPGPCYWDAETRGNGEGRSFVVDADGTVWPR